MHRMRRIAPICVVLFLCAVSSVNAQNDPKGPAMPAAKQNTFGLGSGGGPTPRRQAASQAATRAVAVCSGLWDGGRTLEQINADNGGLGGTEAMKTQIDSGAGFRIAKFCADVLAAID